MPTQPIPVPPEKPAPEIGESEINNIPIKQSRS